MLRHTWTFFVQKVTEFEEVPLNYDQEGHTNQQQDDHIH